MKKQTKLIIWGSLGAVVAGGIFLAWNQKSKRFPNLVFKKKTPAISKRKVPQESAPVQPQATITRTISGKG